MIRQEGERCTKRKNAKHAQAQRPRKYHDRVLMYLALRFVEPCRTSSVFCILALLERELVMLSPLAHGCIFVPRTFPSHKIKGQTVMPSPLDSALIQLLHRTKILNMNIGSEACVVGEIPPRVIWIFIDDDVVASPIPIGAEGQIEW